MPTESEIKLRLAPAYLPEVREHSLIGEYARQDLVCKYLQSTYFDTPDLRLLKQEMGLRVRRLDNQWIQTLKGGSSGGAGLHRRQEWESQVENNVPDLERLAAEARVGVLGEANLETRLIPIFGTDFWRTSWVLRLASESTIELALDQGYIRSSDCAEPLFELELELKQGHEKDLYWAALQLAGTFPVAVEHASKAERGYRLYMQQFSPLVVLGPAPGDAATDLQRLSYWLACLQYGERLLLERNDPQGISHLQTATEVLHKRLVGAGQGTDVALQEDLDWLASELKTSEDFTEACKLVAAPRYSRLLLRLGAYLVGLEVGR